MYAGFRGRYATVLALLGVIAVFPLVYAVTGAVPLSRPFATFPGELDGWRAVRDTVMEEDVVGNLKVHDYILRDYRKGDRQVTLYIGYYGSLDRGEEIHSPRVCMPASGWVKVGERTRLVLMPGTPQGSARVVEGVFQKYGRKQVFLFWYRVGDRVLTNELLIKATIIWNTLTRRRPDSAFVRLSTEVEGENVEAAVAAVDDFLDVVVPVAEAYFP